MRKFLKRTAAIIALSLSATTTFAADIMDVAESVSAVKTFIAAIKSVGFAASLKSSGPFTVFAPSDAAFAKLPIGTLDELSKDRSKLAQILAYHVVSGQLIIGDVAPGKIQTIQGGSITLTEDNGKTKVDEATVIQNNIAADNGVIHVIDTVMAPAMP